ncbi:unnamed protein product [Leuciscus chuanchicus]
MEKLDRGGQMIKLDRVGQMIKLDRVGQMIKQDRVGQKKKLDRVGQMIKLDRVGQKKKQDRVGQMIKLDRVGQLRMMTQRQGQGVPQSGGNRLKRQVPSGLITSLGDHKQVLARGPKSAARGVRAQKGANGEPTKRE